MKTLLRMFRESVTSKCHLPLILIDYFILVELNILVSLFISQEKVNQRCRKTFRISFISTSCSRLSNSKSVKEPFFLFPFANRLAILLVKSTQPMKRKPFLFLLLETIIAGSVLRCLALCQVLSLLHKRTRPNLEKELARIEED